jgi:hypothetical protein
MSTSRTLGTWQAQDQTLLCSSSGKFGKTVNEIKVVIVFGGLQNYSQEDGQDLLPGLHVVGVSRYEILDHNHNQ